MAPMGASDWQCAIDGYLYFQIINYIDACEK